MLNFPSPLSGLGSPFGRRVGFTPASLFASGEVGAFYDPSDLSTLYQDAAGTTPVTADGDPVGYMGDKSGNGNHATQPTAAARPVYKTDGTLHWLAFDGVDDYLITSTITPGTDKVQVFAGVRKLSDGSTKEAVTFGGQFSIDSGIFALRNSEGEGTAFVFRSVGDGSIGRSVVNDPAPVTAVATCLADIAADTCILRIDGVVGSQPIVDQGAGNYTNGPLAIGARIDGVSNSDMNLYSLTVRLGPNLDTPTIQRAEQYTAKRTGITL